MDDHFNCNLCTMCVIAKSNGYVQNVKDWRLEFINQDFLNCILKCLPGNCNNGVD